ncbi:hypothetical protein KX729_22570 [Rhizobium sp. XQZ8]|nr:hypothetical protein [Rhizobium populisoli]
MYSHADRICVVELYIGKRDKARIRQLDYPAKNALRNWYPRYELHRDLRIHSVARAPKFSEAQKQATLEQYGPSPSLDLFNNESIGLATPGGAG